MSTESNMHLDWKLVSVKLVPFGRTLPILSFGFCTDLSRLFKVPN